MRVVISWMRRCLLRHTFNALFTGILSSLSVCLISAASWAAPATMTDVEVESPTFHCIGLRCLVWNDVNTNATVRLDYRQRGSDAWKRALDLFRVETAALHGVDAPPTGSHRFAGSVFFLEPDTEYELRLTMTDPDGGDAVKGLSAKTWTEPIAPKPRRVLHVVPGVGGGTGTEKGPFKGIVVADAAAVPGDLILLHKGVYTGAIRLTKAGTAAAPIVWRAAGDGEAVLEGPERSLGVNARGLRHLFFEGLTFRRGNPTMRLGNASYMTLRRCRFTDVGWAVIAAGRQERICILDCTFEGIRKWPRNAPDQPKGEHRAIELSGIGHVVAYNRIAGFRDAIDTRGPLPIRSVDFHNNDISECTDDGIELDFAETNCRAYLNRITNAFCGISFQPSRGGPNYAIRNAMYNLQNETYKLHFTGLRKEWKPLTSGGVILHNTVVRKGRPLRVWAGDTPVHYYFMRNNLYVAGGVDRLIDMQCDVRFADWDYNVYAGGPPKIFGKWFRTFHQTRDAFVKGTGQEAHSRIVESTKGFFESNVPVPDEVGVKYAPTMNDLRLSKRSPAIDAGTVLPNINDGFKGKAPDAGAYEFGRPLPHYGPRPVGRDTK